MHRKEYERATELQHKTIASTNISHSKRYFLVFTLGVLSVTENGRRGASVLTACGPGSGIVHDPTYVASRLTWRLRNARNVRYTQVQSQLTIIIDIMYHTVAINYYY